jgi:MoxR-like ATPase
VSLCACNPHLPSCAQSPFWARPVTALFYKPPDILEDVLRSLLVGDHVYLSGAPGIGKTAMAREVYNRCMKVRPLWTYIDMKPAVV